MTQLSDHYYHRSKLVGMLECKSGTALSVLWKVLSLNKKFVGKIFVGDTSLRENFSWMEANHGNNEIKSTMKIFTYTVTGLSPIAFNHKQIVSIIILH